jgi:ribulose kinase
MHEGGQLSTGQLIDFIITTHSAYPELKERVKQEGKAIHIGSYSSSNWGDCSHI